MKIPFSYFENHQLNEFRVRGNRGQGYQRMRSAEIIISTIMKDFKPKTTPSTQKMSCTWDKPFKNGPSKICGRQALKNFTWSILEYLNTYNDSISDNGNNNGNFNNQERIHAHRYSYAIYMLALKIWKP